jgi:hypothetical protein
MGKVFTYTVCYRFGIAIYQDGCTNSFSSDYFCYFSEEECWISRNSTNGEAG